MFVQEAEKEKSADDADRKDPSFVPRHDRFWGHDDRDTDLPEIERYKFNQTNLETKV